MKTIVYYFALIVLLVGCINRPLSNELIVCGDDQIIIIDETASNGADVRVIWRWQVSEAAAQLPSAYQKYMIPLDECKPVDDGKCLLATSSGGGVLLLERATKKCLFYAYAPMAHSADMLPDGRIAVALSTHTKGNSLEIYDRNMSEIVLYRDSLYSGHGVVWNAARKRLYALGYDELREYSLVDWLTQSPSLHLERRWTIPGKSGHDLFPLSDNELLVSEHHGVHLFDIAGESFAPFAPLETAENVKSVNSIAASGKLVYTKAEESWWTHNIYLHNPDKTIHIPDVKLYKVRLARGEAHNR
jgi:hypothetical protein